MSDAAVPDKPYFRIGEVSRLTGVKPYVLRYWESEFPSVAPAKTRANQRIYRREDVERILTIKRLLYTERYTIAGARAKLEAAEGAGAATAGGAPAGATGTQGAVEPGGNGAVRGAVAGARGEELRKLLKRVRDELQSLRSLLE